MELIQKWAKLNFAVLLIGDNFTMGAELHLLKIGDSISFYSKTLTTTLELWQE